MISQRVFVTIVFCISFNDLATSVLEDRAVIREGTSFELRCNHNSKIVNRIKWNFQPSDGGTMQTVYDSRNDTFDDTRYHVSCKNSLQYSCIVKLDETRKKDSGKYICLIAQIGMDSLEVFTQVELVVRGPKSDSMTVNIGDSVVLRCQYNIANVSRVGWDHISIDDKKREHLDLTSLHKASQSNYVAYCEPHKLSCDLKIIEVNKESAGRYICKHGDSFEYEEKYGFYEMTDFIEIDLIAGEITCNTNGMNNIAFIGENDCYGINPDVLNLECSFNYYGNVDINFQNLRWEGMHEHDLQNKSISSQHNLEVKQDLKTVSIQSNFTVANSMIDKTFQCILANSSVKPCQLNKLKIDFVKNVTGISHSVYSDDLRNVKCHAMKSEGVHCSYYWVHEAAGAKLKTPYKLLPAENMNLPGIYTCIAKCRMGKHTKKCNIKAMEIEVIQVGSTLVTGLIVTIIVLLAIIAIISYILYRVYLRKKCNNCLPTCYSQCAVVLEENNKDDELKKDESLQELKEHLLIWGKNTDDDKVKADELEKCREFCSDKIPKKVTNGTLENDIDGNLSEAEGMIKWNEVCNREQNLKVVKEESLAGRASSFEWNENKIFLCYFYEPMIDAFVSNDLNTPESSYDCGHTLREVLDLLIIDDNLYFVGRGFCKNVMNIKILKINKSLKGPSKEIYNCKNEGANPRLSKSWCGDILLAFFNTILLLSVDGKELNSFRSWHLYDALELNGRRYIVCLFSHLLEIGYDGEKVTKRHSSFYDLKLWSPRCLAMDKFQNIYVYDDVPRKVFVFSHGLKHISSLDLNECIHKLCYDKANEVVLCLTNKYKLITIRLE